jgi:hypothetical protein
MKSMAVVLIPVPHIAVVMQTLAVSGTAKLIACLLTYPHDVCASIMPTAAAVGQRKVFSVALVLASFCLLR